MDRNREFEQLLRDGITAARTQQRRLAQSLLNQAIILNPSDARPYVWLSATTDDPQEQRGFLEQAVIIDPNNVAARRGLALLAGKLDTARLMPEGEGRSLAEMQQARAAASPNEPAPNASPLDAEALIFQCPQCGGRMSFAIETGHLTCQYCGHIPSAQPDPAIQKERLIDEAERPLDFVLPTTTGHSWASAQHRLVCERCGALSLLPAGEKSTLCPYCGSTQLIASSETRELIDPQLMATIQVDAAAADRHVKNWLGRGLFAPDDLLAALSHLELRPGFYSFWTFDGTVEVRWTCEVNEGHGDNARWVPRSGVEMRFFDDVLVPGVKALEMSEVESIAPFNLKDLAPFKPELVAGWPTLIYDRSLNDASLLGREQVVKGVRRLLPSTIEPGREKRNISSGGGSWSGMTYKHLLLPVWIGTYLYRGKEYHLLINGQTGKVGGKKPLDKVKLIFAILTTALLLLLLALLVWFLNGQSVG